MSNGSEIHARTSPRDAVGQAQEFESFLDEFAAAFAGVSAPDVDAEIERWLGRLVRVFGAGRSSIGEITPDGRMRVTHAWPAHEPADFHADQEVSIPLALSGRTIGVLVVASPRGARRWPDPVLQRMRVVGTVLANAIERKRAVLEYMQMSRALEHAGRVAAIGELASAFAHDIKQPLGASLINAQTALKLLGALPPDLAEVRAALEDIAADNHRAGEIVDELRRFLSRQGPKLAPIAVGEMLDDVVRFVTPQARSHGVEVSAHVDRGVPDVVADRVQVQQVLVNLMMNSFDALAGCPREGRKVMLFAARGTADRVEVSVSDTGPGVPESLRATMFDAFVTTKANGLGIGLAIAQTIAGAHGGRLAYLAGRGGGAVFTFSLRTAATEAHDD